MLLVIDNYDSFTYNLVQYLGELGAEVRVVRNDEITVDEIAALAPRAHRDLARARARRTRRASRSRSSRRYAGQDPDPGRLPRPPGDRPGVRRQGRARRAGHARQDLEDLPRRARALFAGLPNPFEATRYHSLLDRARERCPTASRSRRRPAEEEIMARAPQDAAGRGRAVPPRVDPDHRRARSCCATSSSEEDAP